MKRAVVLFNLGGPDSLEAVRPFLYNLFSDPAILGVPQPLRFLLAHLISRRRAPVAREIYTHLGGKSPLLEQTQGQAEALESLLGEEWRVFICMRYWHPMSGETARAVKEWDPDEVLLLPLYPQFSTTTTGSSLADWRKAAQKAGMKAPVRAVCCYPMAQGWVAAQTALLMPVLEELRQVHGRDGIRVLFSAHGLPQKVVDKGDPYQWQVEQGAAAIAAALGEGMPDWRVCYQSRVGPLKWLEPSTDTEIIRASAEGKAVIVVPIAFVSEHSETLVELDIEYRELAEQNSVADYRRIPALGETPDYMEALAEMCRQAQPCLTSEGGKRCCPKVFEQCPVQGESGV